MDVSLTIKMEASNISSIAELVLHELARRPNATMTDTTDLFLTGENITPDNVEIVATNLEQTGQILTAPRPVSDQKTLRILGMEIIDKLLKASQEKINQV